MTTAITPTPTTRKPYPVPTYSATETLPDGRERILITSLTYCQVLAHRFDERTWAVSWSEDRPDIRKP